MKYSKAEMTKMIAGVENWYHRVSLAPDLVTPGITDASTTLSTLDIPMDCRGKRVLDLGARDGYFTFELEKRGAEVVAVDYVPPQATGFSVLAQIFDSKATYLHENIYNLSCQNLGKFDIVLFLGLLYHLPDPMRALNLVRSLCKDQMFLETHCLDNAVQMPQGTFCSLATLSPVLADIPLMQFHPGRSLNNDPTNYWSPNLAALRAMLSECQFSVTAEKVNHDRAIVQCRTKDSSELSYLNAIATSSTC